jgi:hypothetical protein
MKILIIFCLFIFVGSKADDLDDLKNLMDDIEKALKVGDEPKKLTKQDLCNIYDICYGKTVRDSSYQNSDEIQKILKHK